MSDVYSPGDHWRDWEDGWLMTTAPFDFGKTGVAIWNGVSGKGSERHAVTIDAAGSVPDALGVLRAWRRDWQRAKRKASV